MSTNKKNYYAIAKGKKPGLYQKWQGEDGALEQVQGFNGAVYKGFFHLEDALEWLQAHGILVPEHETYKKQDQETDDVFIYTDGSSLGNPGPGGYGVILSYIGHKKEISRGFRKTTNNRMEIKACISGLSALKKESKVTIFSDSKYVVDCMRQGWARQWKVNGWKRNKTEIAENADLWGQLLQLCDKHQVNFIWIKGHGGKPENERCDQLAQNASRSKSTEIDEVYEKQDQATIFED